MLLCDRTWYREGVPVEATTVITFNGPEIEEEYHLCEKEMALVREFIINPKKWARGKAKILRLKDNQ